MKVLVTGGAGFIGSHLVADMVSGGHEVAVLDSLEPQVHGPDAGPRLIQDHIRRGAVRFFRGRVEDAEAVASAAEGAEAIVHLAAAVGLGQSMYEPARYVRCNAHGAAVVLEQAIKQRGLLRRLVVASSMSVYGEGAARCSRCNGSVPAPRGPARLEAGRWELPCAACEADMVTVPTPETQPSDVTTVYAATKKHQEDLFVAIGRAYKLPTFALRFFNVYGPGQSLRNPYTGVAAIFLSRLASGESPEVFEDGMQTRDFVHVRDVARALRLATTSDQPGVHVLNVGSGRALTVRSLAETLACGLGVDIAPRVLSTYRAGDVRHCTADARTAERQLGFRAEWTIEDGLRDLTAWWAHGPHDGVLLDQSGPARAMNELRARGLVH